MMHSMVHLSDYNFTEMFRTSFEIKTCITNTEVYTTCTAFSLLDVIFL